MGLRARSTSSHSSLASTDGDAGAGALEIDPPSQPGALGVVVDIKRATGASSVVLAVARAVSLVK